MQTQAAEFSKRTTLNEQTRNGRTYRLVHRGPGLELAGAGTRMREQECWSVLFYMDGAEHGQSFRTEEEARALFTRWTADAQKGR